MDSSPTKDNTEPMLSEKHRFSATTVYRIIMPIVIVIMLLFGAYTLFKINIPAPGTPMKGGSGLSKISYNK
jgi:hypothetical protein